MRYTTEPNYSARAGSSALPKTIESAGVTIPLPREAGSQRAHRRCRPRRYVIGTWITEEAYQQIVQRYQERGGRGRVSLSGVVAEIVYRDLGLSAAGHAMERPASRAVPAEVQASEDAPVGASRSARRYSRSLEGLQAWFREAGGDDDMLRDFLAAFSRYRLPDGVALRRGGKHAAVLKYWEDMKAYQSTAQIAKWFGISVRTLRRVTRSHRLPRRPSTWTGRDGKPARRGVPMRIAKLV